MLSDEKRKTFSGVVNAKLKELAEPGSWPLKALATVHEQDLDAFDAEICRAASKWETPRSSADSQINLPIDDWTRGLTTLIHRFGRRAFGWDAQYRRQLGVQMRTLSVQHVELTDVRYTWTLGVAETTAPEKSWTSALEGMAKIARTEQVFHLLEKLAPKVRKVEPLTADGVKCTLNSLPKNPHRTITTFENHETVATAVKNADVIHHKCEGLAALTLHLNVRSYKVLGVAIAASSNPITIYRSADLGASVEADGDGGAKVTLEERRAYVAANAMSVVILGEELVS